MIPDNIATPSICSAPLSQGSGAGGIKNLPVYKQKQPQKAAKHSWGYPQVVRLLDAIHPMPYITITGGHTEKEKDDWLCD